MTTLARRSILVSAAALALSGCTPAGPSSPTTQPSTPPLSAAQSALNAAIEVEKWSFAAVELAGSLLAPGILPAAQAANAAFQQIVLVWQSDITNGTGVTVAQIGAALAQAMAVITGAHAATPLAKAAHLAMSARLKAAK